MTELAPSTLAPCTPDPQTWKLTLAYDGTEFSGWQVQPGERTVQGELQAALGRIAGESPLPQGSGRTDAGVHALAQVASFTLAAPIPAENLQRALNRTLPASIRILEARRVRSAFHARHSAVAKTYEYRVFLEKSGPRSEDRSEDRQPSRICPPFLAPYVFAYPWPLDAAALDEAARAFVGEHDFLSFAATDPDRTARGLDSEGSRDEQRERQGRLQDEFEANPHAGLEERRRTTIRTVFSSNWERQRCADGDLLVYRVRGNGFLHHMVRNLVGTQLDVGRGRLQATRIPAMIAARARAAAGPTAPARGLFLHSVEYDGAE